MKKILLLVGTKKGLLLFTSTDRKDWSLQGPFQSGKEINHAIYDARTGRIHATANDAWFGSELVWSPDLGQNWEKARTNPAFPENSGLKLERIWHIEPGPVSHPEVLYAGVAPAALFRTDDSGQTWHEMTSLTQHPTRPKWHPGAGGLCLHSIALDSANPQRMFVGISAVGVFRTDDGGATWKTVNQGTRAEFLPERFPEYGQCVHKLLKASGQSSLLFSAKPLWRLSQHGRRGELAGNQRRVAVGFRISAGHSSTPARNYLRDSAAGCGVPLSASGQAKRLPQPRWRQVVDAPDERFASGTRVRWDFARRIGHG